MEVYPEPDRRARRLRTQAAGRGLAADPAIRFDPPFNGAFRRLAAGSGAAMAGSADPGDAVSHVSLTHLARLDALALRARVAGQAGDTEESRRILDEIANGDARYMSGLHLRNAAYIAAAIGETQMGLDLLRRGFATGLPFGAWVHTHPALASIRGLPEYGTLTALLD